MNLFFKFRPIIDKIVEHFIGCLISAFFGIFVLSFAIFWKWARDEHTLVFYGWVWLLFCLGGLFLFFHFVFIILQRTKKIKDPTDIRNVLDKWWRHTEERCSGQQEFTLYFSSIDKTECLRKGSAKQYLREVVTKDGKWSVVREGPDTLLVKGYPPEVQLYTS